MPLYYCTDAEITNILSANLSDSAIETDSSRDTILRKPATEWIGKVYADTAPFPGISLAEGYLVNQADHTIGDLTVAIDGGSGTPVAGEQFYAFDDKQAYTISDYSGGVLTYSPAALTAFENDKPIMIGTPSLLRLAATWFACSVAYNILRDDPEDDSAAAAYRMAKGLLGVDSGGKARAKPWVGYPVTVKNNTPMLIKI